uniref:Uncharacterized protein n=1 Tax=Anguilla anguilla TaxID=7936 RepID=A0A0E9T1A8_ANGAN
MCVATFSYRCETVSHGRLQCSSLNLRLTKSNMLMQKYLHWILFLNQF